MSNADATRYPLSWPAGRARASHRAASRFKVSSFTRVRDELLNELKLMKARNVILSSNLKLRLDGLPLANQAQPSDPGVAVYFTTADGIDVAFACDRWRKIEDNMQAIAHTIDALRGIARWGTGDMVKAAFSGFAALPAARVASASWWDVLGVVQHAPGQVIHDAFRALVLRHHPDRGGEPDKMVEINRAYDSFKRERGL